MPNLDEDALQNVIKRPKFLDLFIAKGGKGYALKRMKMATTLKMMNSDDCLTYNENEFIKEFGKHAIASTLAGLKRYGIRKPRIVKDKGTIYIWANSEV